MNPENIDILNRIYNLVLDRNIREYERNLLLEIKHKIEAGESAKKQLTQLEYKLRPLALRNNLTPLVDEFYEQITSTKLFGLGTGIKRDIG